MSIKSSGISVLQSFSGFEEFANLAGFQHDSDIITPTTIPSSAFSLLDHVITADFFGVDNLFAEDKYEKILDDVKANVCLLDEEGKIIYTNKAWRGFSDKNGGTPERTDLGVNYLKLCRDCATGDYTENAHFFAENLARCISGRTIGEFCFGYQCDSLDLSRWCFAKVFTFHLGVKKITVVAHLTEKETPKQTTPVLRLDPTPSPFILDINPSDSSSSKSSRAKKKRKIIKDVDVSGEDSPLVFVPRGGPPESISVTDKNALNKEIGYTEEYLMLLRMALDVTQIQL